MGEKRKDLILPDCQATKLVFAQIRRAIPAINRLDFQPDDWLDIQAACRVAYALWVAQGQPIDGLSRPQMQALSRMAQREIYTCMKGLGWRRPKNVSHFVRQWVSISEYEREDKT